MSFVNLIGFAPDLPPETPGVMTDCQNILPAENGFVSAPSRKDTGLGTLPLQAKGMAIVRRLDNTYYGYCGTVGKLYRSTGTWTDVSKAGGYTLGVDHRWRFTQFGNVTIAAAKSETMQSCTTGSFANLSGTAPKAAIVETINNQVFAFNTTDGSFGDDPTRWWCSALGNETDWTVSVNTQCVSGQLLDAPGPITAGRRLGDIIVAYKERAMFVGSYVGVPQVWNWQRLPGDIGASCQEAVVTTGTSHYFPGPDDFYMFDGSRPVRLNSPLRKWYFNRLDASYAYRTVGVYDRLNARIYWWFCSRSSGGVLDTCIVYHVITGQWGRMDSAIDVAAEYIAAGITYDGLGALYATYDDLPTTISFDSPFWTSGNAELAVVGTDKVTYTHGNIPASSSITTGHIGDSTNFSTVNRVRPRFIVTPATSQMLYSYSNLNADNFVQTITSTYSNGFYDMLWSARWHKFEFQFTGNVTIPAFEPKLTVDSTE